MEIKINDLTVIIKFANKIEEKLIKKFVTFKDDRSAFFGGKFHPEAVKDVCMGKDVKEYFVCFAGLAREIIVYAKQNNISITKFEDNRTHFNFQKKDWTHDELRKFFNPNFKYVEHQIRSLQAMIKTNTGICVLPTSAGKCVSGNTNIIINGKEIKIKKLFKNFKEEEVRKVTEPLKVLTEKGEQEVEYLYKTNKRDVIRLELKNGFKLTGVPEHRVMTKNGWKFLKDLTLEDYVLCEKKNKKNWKEFITKNSNHEFEYVQIKKLKNRNKKTNCYDLQVKNTHSFIGNGIVNHNTTIMSAYIRLINMSTLILVNKVMLGIQLRNGFIKDGIDCGICSGKGVEEGVNMVSTIQSVGKIGNLTRFKCILLDEVQNASASTFQDFLKQFGCPLKFGFSATPCRNGDYLGYAKIRQFVGSPIIKVETKELLDNGVMAKPHIYLVKNECKEDDYFDYQTAYSKEIVNSERRNSLVKNIVDKYGSGVLIVVNIVEHGEILQKLIPNSVFISGETPIEDRENYIKEFDEGRLPVLIGSTIMQEGISITHMQAMVLACGGKSNVAILQKIGRSLRFKEGEKETVDFFDIIDTAKFLSKHSKMRVSLYKKAGFTDMTLLDSNLEKIKK